MGANGLEEADLELMRERFALALPGARVGARRIAVMAVEAHPPGAAPVEPSPTASRGGGTLTQEVARRLRASLRRTDVVVVAGPLRYYVLVERLEDGPFAAHVADRLVAAVREPTRVDGRDAPLVASVGVSVYPDDGDHLEDLVRGAEAAMAGARMSGGDLFGFHSNRLTARAGRRLEVERALAGALELGELDLHYQPQLDVRDGSIAGVEALLRWKNARLGAVGPDEFIPLLEANGGILPVGRWVLDRACAQAAAWARDGRPLRMGVNVSARQLADPELTGHVFHAIEAHGLAPTLLELELTESVLVDNVEETRRRLEALRAGGVRVALDDFGTGYASLACLRQFPMDTLKIDRQFVRGLPVDPENAAITSAICALAGSLRLHLVAEGVETDAEEEFLGSLRCHIVQGFRHARPMPSSALADWIRRRPWA